MIYESYEEPSNALGGLFIVLYNRDALDLYLKEGLYGFLMNPVASGEKPHNTHYKALADYACARQGSHVFFFLERKIFYAGQIIGSSNFGAFYLNGVTSPLGREANANLYWNETSRYGATDGLGIFLVENADGLSPKGQPFLIRFQDDIGLFRREISSDDLYFELGSYPYPLPSNAIQGMGFCTMTPGETNLALRLFSKTNQDVKPLEKEHHISKESTLLPFAPELGIQNLHEAFLKREINNEAQIEFSVIANPTLLPEGLRPTKSDTICRQVPISPFKPFNMDRADICYYDARSLLKDGTVPNRIIELKKDKASVDAIQQAERYMRWLRKITNPAEFKRIRVYILAPEFTKTAKVYPSEFAEHISLHEFSGGTYHLPNSLI